MVAAGFVVEVTGVFVGVAEVVGVFVFAGVVTRGVVVAVAGDFGRTDVVVGAFGRAVLPAGVRCLCVADGAVPSFELDSRLGDVSSDARRRVAHDGSTAAFDRCFVRWRMLGRSGVAVEGAAVLAWLMVTGPVSR